MAVFEADANSCQSRRNPLCTVIDLIETGSFAGKSPCDLIDETSARETSDVEILTNSLTERCPYLPPTDYAALCFPHRHVIPHNYELDAF